MSYSKSLSKLVLGLSETRFRQLQKLTIYLKTIEHFENIKYIDIVIQIETMRYNSTVEIIEFFNPRASALVFTMVVNNLI